MIIAAAAAIVVIVAITLFDGTEESTRLDVVDSPADVDTPPAQFVGDGVLTVVGAIFGVEGYHQYQDATEVWTGFETDLLEEISSRLGMAPDYVAAPFPEIFPAL